MGSNMMVSPNKYVIVRSRDQGVMVGFYQYHRNRQVVLKEARQVYRWTGGRLTLVDVAQVVGPIELSEVKEELVINGGEGNLSGEVVRKTGFIVLESCGIIECTDTVRDYLRGLKATEKKK